MRKKRSCDPAVASQEQDGGYAWVILLVSVVLCVFKGAQFGNIGYFLVKFLSHYDITKSEVTIIGGLNLFVGNLLGMYFTLICVC